LKGVVVGEGDGMAGDVIVGETEGEIDVGLEDSAVTGKGVVVRLL
jgi:hypothetical protein